MNEQPSSKYRQQPLDFLPSQLFVRDIVVVHAFGAEAADLVLLVILEIAHEAPAMALALIG
jgi:hypothetical protein